MKYKIVPASEIVQKEDIIPNGTVHEMAAEEEPLFLNLMLHHRDLLQDTIDALVITTDHFFWEQNARFFGILLCNYIENNGALLTRDTMETLLCGDENFVAGMEYFYRVEGLRASPEDYERLKKGLVDRHLQQRFYELAASHEKGVCGVGRVLDATSDQGKLIAEFQEKLASIADDAHADRFSRVSNVGDIVDDVIDALKQRREDPDTTRGLLTGFSGIDNVLYGFRPGDYGMIIGYPGGGKTTMMFNMAINMAERGAKVCYVTVESSEKEMVERMLARAANVSLKVFRRGGMDGDGFTPERWNKVLLAAERIKKTQEQFTFVCVPQKTSINTVTALVGSRHRLVGFDVVFLDYLDVIAPEEENTRNPYLDINCVSVAFQAFIKKSGLVGITAQSFNNEAIKLIKKQQEQKGENGEITAISLEGIGGTQKLSRDGDYIWGLIHRDKLEVIDVYWMKSRFTGKEKPFRLVAHLDCCHLVDEAGAGNGGSYLFGHGEAEGAGENGKQRDAAA